MSSQILKYTIEFQCVRAKSLQLYPILFYLWTVACQAPCPWDLPGNKSLQAHAQKNQPVDRRESPEIGPNTKEKLVYSKAGISNHWGKCITQ